MSGLLYRQIIFKKGIHNPAVITSLHHVPWILQIDGCAQALLWCSSSIYSQSQHYKQCKYFGNKAVRTPWKFGEKETAWKTEVEDRRQGVVIFMKSHVSHVTLNRTLKFMSCQTTGSSLGDRADPALSSCMHGWRRGQIGIGVRLSSCWWFKMHHAS